MRGLNENFMYDLLLGSQSHILEMVKSDNSLDLEIRENSVSIYYRGGNILKVSVTPGSYLYHFDQNYFTPETETLKTLIENYRQKSVWLSYFALTKQVMDIYFSTKASEEREFQQLVVRENNYSSIANGTDYFIIDIEYDNHAKARFDIVAIEWISESVSRKLSKSYKPRLVIFEMKYGDKAIKGKAGLCKHLSDFSDFKKDSFALDEFKKEMLNVFEQKRELGVIPCLASESNRNAIIEFDEGLDFVFLLANHDPSSRKLRNELKDCNQEKPRLITANLMGYGLYKDNTFDWKDS